jgi:hypothetical protein
MKFRNLLGAALVALLAAPSLKAQTKDFPAQITFVTPIGTSGNRSTDYIYNFSINALAGTVGGIEGLQLGGLLNQTKGNVKGAEFAGLLNLTKGNVRGGQFGGLMNLSDTLKGIQAGGLLNKSSSLDGIQLGELQILPTKLKDPRWLGSRISTRVKQKDFK